MSRVRIEDLPEGYRQAAATLYADQLAREQHILPAPGMDVMAAEARRLDVESLARAGMPDRLPNPAAVERGRRNARKGRDFEDAVDSAIEGMRLTGIADLETQRPDVRPTWGKDATGRSVMTGAVYAGTGNTDRTGVVAGGRFVRVELKTCSESRMNLRQHVKPHQREALERALQFGGLAFLLVLFDRDDPLRWHRYDWRAVRGTTAVEADEASVVDTLFLADVAAATRTGG